MLTRVTSLLKHLATTSLLLSYHKLKVGSFLRLLSIIKCWIRVYCINLFSTIQCSHLGSNPSNGWLTVSSPNLLLSKQGALTSNQSIHVVRNSLRRPISRSKAQISSIGFYRKRLLLILFTCFAFDSAFS